jgi:hypothetical protein
MPLPSIEQLFRGARSIYVGVFEGNEFELRLRRTPFLHTSDFPQPMIHKGLKDTNHFAEAELTHSVVTGRGSHTHNLTAD